MFDLCVKANNRKTGRKTVTEAFGGSLNLILWILPILGGGYYSYRCLFATKGFVDEFGMGDGSVFMTRLTGTCVAASTIVGAVALFSGPEGLWPIIAYGLVQSVLAAYFGYTTVNSDWAEIEGVKATAEGYAAPIAFAIVYLILMFRMSDILYATGAVG